MKFIIEKTTEPIRVKETWNYSIEKFQDPDSGKVLFGLMLDNILFTFLNKDQAKLLEVTFAEKSFEDFFNSVGIGDVNLNLQPKAACSFNYERPTGDVF